MAPERSRLEQLRRLAPNPLPSASPLGFPAPHGHPAFAASFSQLRFWRLDQHSDGTACAIPDALHLQGELQPAALNLALQRLVERHEPLRTTYQPGGEDLLQIVAPAQGVDLRVETLRHNAGWEEVTARMQHELERPFDLGNGPLMRGLLLLGQDGEHVLLLNFHYSVFDGWSRSVLYQDLAVLYGAALEGADSPLPKLPVRYADFASWQRRSLSEERLDRLIAYWDDALRNLPRTKLPVDQTVTSHPPYQGHSCYFELEYPLVAALQSLCRSTAATLHMGLLAVVASLLHRHSGQEDIVIGIPVTGRSHPLFESLMGSFVNLLFIRIDLSGEPTIPKLLERVRKASLNAYDHQEIPFVMLEQRRWPSLRPHTCVPVVVNLVDLLWKPSLQRVAVNRLPSPSLRARYELEFRFRHLSGGSLQAKIIYAAGRFSGDSIRALFDEFKHVLSTCVC